MNSSPIPHYVSLSSLADRWGCTPADAWRFLVGGKMGALYTIKELSSRSVRINYMEDWEPKTEAEYQTLETVVDEIRAQFDGKERVLPPSELRALNPSELHRKWHFQTGNVYVSVEEVYQFERENSIQRQSRNAVTRAWDSRRHRERCRGIAALLWENSPDRTIADVIISHEIVSHGCEGRIYAAKTLRKWIKDLAPNRSPGRRPSRN